MTAYSFSDIVLYFTIYSFVGWVCESVFCSINTRKWVNRGFLRGPQCPIYGFGALIILLLLEPLQDYPVAVFLCAFVSTTLLEYFASWLMEKLFGIRWWDYSHIRFNLNGRVCPPYSLCFGFMGLALVYLIHPPIARLVGLIPNQYERVVGSVLVGVFVLDLLSTLNTLVGLEEKLRKLQAFAAELAASNKEHAWFDSKDLAGSLERLIALRPELSAEEQQAADALLQRLESIGMLQHNLRRLLRSFPGMRHNRLSDTLESLKTALDKKRQEYKESGAQLQERIEETKQSWNRRLWQSTKRFGIRTGAAVKQQAVSFASGINFYKLCWIFAIASVIGYIVETLYCLVLNGFIESRQGMIYGPFNQVYGFGAVIMVVLLQRLAKYKDRWLFLGSALVGGAFEYLCSFLQEKMFGTASWEYSGHQFNIGGRTSLMYMFFWGILGSVLIRGIYPRLSRLIERIPNRQGVFFTWVLVIFLGADMLLSALAVDRWAERAAGDPPGNAVEVFLDENYPDDLLREIYPNMEIVAPDS